MKLSVVITAYNVGEYIEQCIDSVCNLKVEKPLEIIVVEDVSTDNTVEVLKKFPNIKIHHNKENIGAGLSRRKGIELATGDYVMLLDGDDYLEGENHLQTLIDRAEETNADVVGGGIKVLKEDGSYDSTSYGNYTCEGYEKISKFWGERIVFMNNKIIRRTMYDTFPYCSRRFIEDTPVIIPILWAANRVEYVDIIGYVYRMRPSSLTHTSTPIKEIVFKGLCWCDLMEFFNKEDPEVFNHIAIKNYIANIMKYLGSTTFSIEEVYPYKDEFFELMFRLVNLIAVTGIKFKEVVKK